MAASTSTSRPAIDVAPTLQRLIHDVESFQIPALLDPSNTRDLMQLESMERDVLSTLQRLETELDNFSMDCMDAGNNAEERAAWGEALQRAQSHVARVKRVAQNALVKARKELKAQARNVLWNDMAASREERDKRQEAISSDRSAEDKLMTASGDVTNALQRAVALMSIELEKSSYSSQLLDESSTSIQRATLEYTSFTSLVSSSTKLIKSMERADFYDAIMILLSFLFFLLCIGYIVKVRIWDRGIGIISFFLRLGGLRGSRSAQEVQQKLKLAKEAAKSIESSKAAELAKATLIKTVASIITTASGGYAVPSPSSIAFEEDSVTTLLPPASAGTALPAYQHDEL